MVKVEVKDLKVWLGKNFVIKGINLEILENSVTSIIGPSGCGKSTFLRSINRMNDLISDANIEGEIMIDDKNIYDPDVNVFDLRRKVGMVFQKPNPFPKSIYENIAYGLKIHGTKDRNKIDEIVEKSSLPFYFPISLLWLMHYLKLILPLPLTYGVSSFFQHFLNG